MPLRELLVVEGDSAAESVKAVRDSSFQAVLPMQGKPLNAIRASAATLKRHELLCAFVSALGFPNHLQESPKSKPLDMECLRYERIVLLFDPDADGIHCSALMVLFIDKVLPQLLEDGRVEIVRPPLFGFEIVEPGVEQDALEVSQSLGPDSTSAGKILFAYSEPECREIERSLERNKLAYNRRYFRGLGGIPSSILQEQCVSPSSRKSDCVGKAEARLMGQILGAY